MKRQLKVRACSRIQYAFRRYCHQKQIEKEIRFMMISSLEIIIAYLRGLRDKKKYISYKLAAVTIQCFLRQSLARMKRRVLFLQNSTENLSIIPDVIEYEFSKYNSNYQIELWRKLMLGSIIFKKFGAIIFARRIQRAWRAAQTRGMLEKERILCRRKHLQRKGYQWMQSFVALQKQATRMKLKGASLIQKTWRRHQAWKLLYQRICQEDEEHRIDRIAMLRIALILQSRWRSKICRRLLLEKRQEHSLYLTKMSSVLKLQSCYRRRLSTRILISKRRIATHWEGMVMRWLKRERAFISKEAHTQFVYKLLIDHRAKAALTLAFVLGAIFRKRQLAKQRRKEQRELSANMLQAWWRLKMLRNKFLVYITSTKMIQRNWRVTRSQRLFMKVYRQERSRNLAKLAQEKKALFESRIQRQIVSLFSKSKENAAKKIQAGIRQYLDQKRKKEKLRLQLEMEREKRASEDARLNEIIQRKQQAKQFKVIAKSYMKLAAEKVTRSAKNIASLDVIKGIKNQRRKSLERRNLVKELLYYDALKSTRKDTKAIPCNHNILKYRATMQQLFGSSQWFDKNCETLMFRYLLWPEDILALRR